MSVLSHAIWPCRSRLRSGRIRPRHAALKTALAAFAGVLVALSISGTGQASPSPAELEAQIDKAWNDLEPIIEQHNKVAAELEANRAKAKELTDQLRPLELQVDLALSRVSGISAHYYKSGDASALNAILTSGSPTALAEQLMMLDQVARNEMGQIKDVIALKRKYDAQRKPLDELLVEEAEQEADLANKQAQINAEIKRLNDLRIKTYGSTASAGARQPVPCPYEYLPTVGGRAAKIACQQIGDPYVWAASGPNSFDCSGLTMYAWTQAWAQMGVKPQSPLGHYTKWQYSETKRISKADLQPGDLVFYYSDIHHVAIYVGGGWIVHAPNSGDVVRMKRYDATPIAGYGRPY